jgi:hypothetical protein
MSGRVYPHGMISPEDIQQLIQNFSPKALSEKVKIGSLSDLPSLLPTLSGTGLVTQARIADQFEHSVRSGLFSFP